MNRLPLLTAMFVALGAHSQTVSLEEPKMHGGGFSSFAFLPDGQTIIGGTQTMTFTLNGRESKGGGQVLLWNVKTGKIRKTVGSHENVEFLSASADGSTAASVSRISGVLKIWDLRGGRSQTLQVGVPRSTSRGDTLFALSPNGKFVAAVTSANASGGGSELAVWDASSGRQLWKSSVQQIEALLFSGDSSSVVTSAEETKGQSLATFESATGKERWKSTLERRPRAVAASPTRGFVAVSDDSITFFDSSNGVKTSELKTKSAAKLEGIVVASDGSQLAGFDSSARGIAWVDLRSGQVVATQSLGSSTPNECFIGPDLKAAIVDTGGTTQVIALRPAKGP